MARTKICDDVVRERRLAKARTFLEQADVVLALAGDEEDVADAAVTLLVHAEIAAADVKHLKVLLGLKFHAGDSALRTTS